MKLTEQVKETIVRDILEGRYNPGDKIPSEREMADLTSTSRITVRRAYEQLETSGILIRKAGAAGTCVTEQFQGNGDEIESVALLTSLRDPFVLDFVEAVQDQCNENDTIIVLGTTRESVREQLDMALRMMIRGIRNMIVWGFDRQLDMEAFARIRVLGANMVFFDRVRPGPFADFVGLDNQHAVQSLIDIARNDGCLDFVYVDVEELNIDSNLERKMAFTKLCEQEGLVHSYFSVHWPLASHKQVNHDACLTYFRDRPTKQKRAVICVNDRVALDMVEWIPPGVKVYSIDGTREAADAGIKSYSQPIAQMAEASLKLLDNQRKKGRGWKQQIVRFKGTTASVETVT